VTTRIVARRIKWGILGLPLSGLLYLQTLLITGDYIQPDADLQRFAEQVTSTRFHFSVIVDVFQIASVLIGVFALYAYLATTRAERWALAALVLFVVQAIAGPYMLGPFTNAIPAAERYLEGQRDALAAFVLAADPANYPALLLVGFNVLFLLFFPLSNGLFGIAIWRSGTLPQGAAILWISAAILSVVVLNPWYYLGGWIDALLIALELGGSGWIAWSVWQQPNGSMLGTS
jgi:hypothetical protein